MRSNSNLLPKFQFTMDLIVCKFMLIYVNWSYSWLLRDPDMKVRSSYKPYMEASEKYLEKVLDQVKDLQVGQRIFVYSQL